MNLMPVGEFKAKFSEILQKVQQGASFGITYGKSKKKVAVLVPFGKQSKIPGLKLGLIKTKSFKIKDKFNMTEEEFLGL